MTAGAWWVAPAGDRCSDGPAGFIGCIWRRRCWTRGHWSGVGIDRRLPVNDHTAAANLADLLAARLPPGVGGPDRGRS